MNAFINYLIEANLGLIFFSVIYFLLLHRETQFNVKRAYLLGAMLASIVFPLIEFSTTQPVIPSIGAVMSITYLPEIIVSASQSASASMKINYWNIAISGYMVITAALFILFCTRIGKLIHALRAAAFVQEGKFRIVESNANHPTFSFFHYIFIGNADQLDQSEKDQVIRHEKLHASRIHSLDLLFTEVLKIAFWFNPIVYVVKNQLASIHEFEADQQAIQHQDPDLYCDLIARASLTSSGLSLVHHFHNSLTLRRIIMINTVKTKISGWKYFVLIPAFAFGMIIISCEEQVKSEINAKVKSASAVTVPSEVATKVKQLQKANPGREYITAEVTDKGIKSFDNPGKSTDKSKSEILSISQFEANENPNGDVRKFIVIEKGDKSEALRQDSLSQSNYAKSVDTFGEEKKAKPAKQQVAESEDEIHKIDQTQIYVAVEQNPRFPGGLAAMAKYLTSELRYPSQARRLGVEGKVFVQFVVHADGTVSDVATVKGIGSGCDEEAVRVVSNSPNWIPGKQDGQAVNVRYIVPINFTL